jgi:hypothetical protein
MGLKMKKHKIDIPIYFGYLILVFENDFKKAIEKLKLDTKGRTNLPEYASITFSERNKKGVSQYFILFKKGTKDHSVIAHEALHVVNWIMSDRGIACDLINDEPQAYLLGWVIKQIYKFK